MDAKARAELAVAMNQTVAELTDPRNQARGFPEPTDDADEFVAGMVKAHEGTGGVVECCFAGAKLCVGIDGGQFALLDADEVDGLAKLLAKFAAHMAREAKGLGPPPTSQHFEVMDEWDPQP